MIQKSRARLVLVGLFMTAAMFIPIYVNWFWAPGIVLALTGVYLIAWATVGQGRWCRNCKKFNFLGRN